jgi:hypothetical protein|tara:strand:- start:2869 stop:3060 length:192 start_codon:yes stop_codon:yes gene_type:complete
MQLATLTRAILDETGIVYLAEEGSNTPWGLLVGGHIVELLDPPTFNTTAGRTPLPVTEADIIG